MFEWIERLEQLGPRGAPIAGGIGLFLIGLALSLVGYSFVSEGSAWGVLGMRGAAFFVAVFAMFFAMLGVRMRTDTRYPDPAEVFPSLPVADFRVAMYAVERPVSACSDCLIHLPATFSTGACPRCSSSVGWHTITNDEDAELICSAIHD